MEEPLVVVSSVAGYGLCVGLLWLAGRARSRWAAISWCTASLAGLLAQGAAWAFITLMFRAMHVGGSYLLLHLALVASVIGIVGNIRMFFLVLRRGRAAR